MPVAVMLFVMLCLPFSVVWPADPDADVTAEPALVTADTLAARLKEIEASTSLDEDTRASLTEAVNKALANLEAAASNRETMDSYVKLRDTAPDKVKQIRAQLEKEKQSQQQISLSVTPDTPFKDIERKFLQEKANLAAVQTKLEDIEAQLERSKERPAAIQKQLAVAKQAREDLESEQKIPAAASENSWVTEARGWARSTRIAALRSEISMLDQELLTLPFRVDLLEAQRDQLARTVKRIAVRLKLLEDLANQQGRAEAQQAEAAAEAAVDEAAGKHPLIQQLAAENAELTRDITAVAAAFKESSVSDEDVDREAARIDDNFRRAREQLEVAGVNEVLGEVLRHQRQSLPDAREIRRKLESLEDENARVTLRQLQQSAELEGLHDLEKYAAELAHGISRNEFELINADLQQLLNSRRELLEKLINLNNSYLRSLTDLEASYRSLLDSSTSYDDFLAENLLWIRSAPSPGLDAMGTIPQQLGHILSPSRWLELPSAVTAGVLHSLPVKVLILLFLVLIGSRRVLHNKLLAMGEPVDKPAIDEFSYTAKALGLTFTLSLTWPLLLLAMAQALVSGPAVAQFAEQVSDSLYRVVPTFFYMQFFSVLCLRGGLAEKHFRWPGKLPASLYRAFYHLKVTLLPVMFLVLLIANDEQVVMLNSMQRLLMVVGLLLVALFFYRLSNLLMQQSVSHLVRHRYFWLGLTVAAPLVLAILAFIGFFYTAGTLAAGLIQSLWIAFGLVVLHQIAVRWLLLTRRRLTLQAARNRLQATRQERASANTEVEGASIQVEEPEIDLVALSDETRKLLSMMLVIIGFFGFWFVWSDILPALNVLNEVTLWHKTAVVAGEETIVPVSLGDMGIALLIVFLTYIAMKRVPPLLEIILLQRVNMTSGGRYTARTLTTYAIVGIGLVAFFRVIGADWSKLQWLFAALGVGIGFGLQEIVANFISGLIILFERPIRVGDVVTIGDTDGVVSRIQIRATTIRTWDRQELLVPNKEFITGRLLNWSLSDQTTRIKVPVGVAYGSDVQQAMALMDEAARQNDTILADPGPYVMFNGFGDNALNLELRCFVGAQTHRIPALTNLHEEINRKFNAAGISISFPQRDIHLDTVSPVDVRILRDGGQASET
jgi:potassium efflux system protein